MPRSPFLTQRPSLSQALKPATCVGVKPRRRASWAIGSVLRSDKACSVARARSHAVEPSELTRGPDGLGQPFAVAAPATLALGVAPLALPSAHGVLLSGIGPARRGACPGPKRAPRRETQPGAGTAAASVGASRTGGATGRD